MNQKHQRSRGVPRVGGVSVTEMSTATGKEFDFIRVITFMGHPQSVKKA